MQRRAFLAGLTGVTAQFAGCSADVFAPSRPRDAYDPSGHASIRPIDAPYVRHGITAESERYLHAWLFRPGDSLSVTDDPDAAAFSDAVDELSGSQFAVLTTLRTAAAVPAYVWPTDARWSDGRLRIELERRTTSAGVAGDEAVGVAITTYEVDGEPPDGADVVFPGGATISVGSAD